MVMVGRADAALATFEADLRRRRVKQKTAQTYVAIAGRFLALNGAPPRRGYSRAQYNAFFDGLLAADYSAAYIQLQLAALRRFLRALGETPPPLEPRDLPRLERKTPETWLEVEDVAAMVAAVRGPGFDDEARCALALATVYGLRVSELRTCERDGDHLIIHVAKSGGRTARQLVPVTIRPYIAAAPVRQTEYRLGRLYHQLERAGRVRRRRGSRSGFHHIRRALNTALARAGVPEVVLQRFLRWQGRGFSGPLYYLRGDTDAMDRQVFRQHPFLHLWT